MSEDGNKFLDIEKSAERLLDALEGLSRETSAYRECKDLADQVGEKLGGLVDNAKGIVSGIEEAISAIKSVGGQEIIAEMRRGFAEHEGKLTDISSGIKREYDEFDRRTSDMTLKLNQLSRVSNQTERNMSDIAARVNQLASDFTNTMAENRKQISAMKAWIYFLLLLSSASLCLNILKYVK